MTLLGRLTLVGAAAVVMVACPHHQQPSSEADNTPATLHVENHNWQDVEIQVVHRGQRSHLASVSGATTTDIVFPRQLMTDLGEVQLVAHAVGTPETIMTAVLVLKPGTQVRWTLESSLSRSTISVY